MGDTRKFERRHGVQPSIRACSFPKLDMCPATVRPELVLSSPRTKGLLEMTFSHLCGCRSRGWTLQNSSTRYAKHCGEGSSGICTLPDWDGLPHAAAKPSRAVVQHGEGCTTQGIMQLQVNWLADTQDAQHLSHFCPVWGTFAHSVGSLNAVLLKC